jgi:hypothetical protein
MCASEALDSYEVEWQYPSSCVILVSFCEMLSNDRGVSSLVSQSSLPRGLLTVAVLSHPCAEPGAPGRQCRSWIRLITLILQKRPYTNLVAGDISPVLTTLCLACRYLIYAVIGR